MLQSHYQNTSTTTSAHLAQTMTLLGLTSSELEQRIDSELANNPALELIDERRCPMCKRILSKTGNCPICSQPKEFNSDEPIVFISPREDFYTSNSTFSNDIPEDPFSYETVDLPTFVLRQVAPELSDEDKVIAAYILTNLDDDGFLNVKPIEIAKYYHRLLSEIENLIKKIQRCDPIGVCAANPKEAMLTQIEILSETMKVPELTRELVDKELQNLGHKQFSELAHKFDVKLSQIQQAVNFITENLNPFPARSHWGDLRNPNEVQSDLYHRPDVMIYHLNEEPRNPLVVEIIMPINGTLRVNPLFRKALADANNEKVEDWKQDIEKASLLIKCIQQRNNAMRMLLEKLVIQQKNFILTDEKNMLPLTRASLAKELDVHESTISRAVSGKTVQLPNKKIVPMSMFFDRSLSHRSVLKEIIESEAKPLSDTELQSLLAEKGINIARRTVAKYRTMEGILPAHLRQSQSD
jgi:RNA polymerase sigma-54 factor